MAAYDNAARLDTLRAESDDLVRFCPQLPSRPQQSVTAGMTSIALLRFRCIWPRM